MKNKELLMIGVVVVLGSLAATYMHDNWLAK